MTEEPKTMKTDAELATAVAKAVADLNAAVFEAWHHGQLNLAWSTEVMQMPGRESACPVFAASCYRHILPKHLHRGMH